VLASRSADRREAACACRRPLDEAGVDRECLAADEARDDADGHHALEHAAQGIALAEAFMCGACE